MRIRVKICGITSSRDAEAAVTAGADALGFVLWNGSPRRVPVADVMTMSLALPPYIARVGVFVDELRPVLLAAMRNARLTAAQLHGQESPDLAAGLDVDWYRVFRVADGDDAARTAAEISRFGDRAFMLDTRAPAPGGTGATFDWGLAAEIGRRVAEGTTEARARMILAGGLTPRNVGDAIDALRGAGLWAVDVSSGVEAAPGIKDPERLSRFVQAVRDAE